MKDQNKVIWVKDLQIYKNITLKATIALPTFKGISIFDIVQISDEQIPFKLSSTSKEEENTQKKPSKKPTRIQRRRKKDRASKKENKLKTTIF